MTGHEHNLHISLLSNSLKLVKMIGDFAEAAGSAKNLPHLGDDILNALSQLLRLPEAALWIRESDVRQYRLIASLGQSATSISPSTLPAEHPLTTLLSKSPRILRYDQEISSTIGSAMIAVHAAVCAPFLSQTHLIGLCTFGPIRGDFLVDDESIAVAETIVRIACNALDHHMAQEDLRRSSTLMRRTDRLRSLEIMAGGFAHEIRNPLTSIKTFVQLAPQRQQDPVFIREFSQLAIEDVHRIERLLHEILDYAGYMSPQPSDADLNELVTSCLCFVSATASQRGIRLRTALAPRLPHLSLDRQQIKQVLMNLLLNALDAMPNGQGSIFVQTRSVPRIEGTPWVQLQVEDQGCGIAPDHLEHIFDPFFTTKHSNSAGDGSGLGLTTAHQIIREHGGELLVESRVGVGSTFSVNLPVPDERATVSAALE
jgi:Signal transduction histidine kinase